MTSKMAPPRRPAQLDDLDDTVLTEVFRAVPADWRRRLPLVCRRWRTLCDAPSSVWEDVHLDFSNGAVEDSGRMYKWFVQRRGGVRRLTLVAETDDDWLAAHLVLGLLAGSLERLTVRGGHDGLGMQSVAWLAVLPQLKSLHLQFEDGDIIESCAVFPPGLEDLTLRPIDLACLAWLPESLTKLVHLCHLHVRGLDLSTPIPPSFPHRLALLGSLTKLKHLEMCRSRLQTLSNEMTALAKLTALNMSRTFMVEAEGYAPLERMTWLQELNLHSSNLGEVPAPVAGLPGLRRLVLSRNRLGELPDGPYLACLEALDVSVNRFPALPAVLLGCTGLECLRMEGNKPSAADPTKQMVVTARDLRKLLHSNTCLRELTISEASIGTLQLAQLRTSFPQVRVTEVDHFTATMSDVSEDDSDFWGSSGTDEGSSSSDELSSSDDESSSGESRSSSDGLSSSDEEDGAPRCVVAVQHHEKEPSSSSSSDESSSDEEF